VALPIALGQAIEAGAWHESRKGALLGIGSGVNSLMIGMLGGSISVEHASESAGLAEMGLVR
jgi:hypothetical protein